MNGTRYGVRGTVREQCRQQIDDERQYQHRSDDLRDGVEPFAFDFRESEQ